MAFDEQFGDRIRKMLQRKKVDFEEKRMMGGLCFMVDDKMCVGIYQNKLMARVNPAEAEELLSLSGAEPMRMTGRAMNGFLFVEQSGVEKDKELDYWIGRCLAFNPLAKSSKKKK